MVVVFDGRGGGDEVDVMKIVLDDEDEDEDEDDGGEMVDAGANVEVGWRKLRRGERTLCR